jgi:hypothetical protein
LLGLMPFGQCTFIHTWPGTFVYLLAREIARIAKMAKIDDWRHLLSPHDSTFKFSQFWRAFP